MTSPGNLDFNISSHCSSLPELRRPISGSGSYHNNSFLADKDAVQSVQPVSMISGSHVDYHPLSDQMDGARPARLQENSFDITDLTSENEQTSGQVDQPEHQLTGCGIDVTNLAGINYLQETEQILVSHRGLDNHGFTGESQYQHSYSSGTFDSSRGSAVRYRTIPGVAHRPRDKFPNFYIVLAVISCILFFPVGLPAIILAKNAHSHHHFQEYKQSERAAHHSLGLALTGMFIGLTCIAFTVWFMLSTNGS